MERHLLAYYIGIVILFIFSVVPLVTGKNVLESYPVNYQYILLLVATLLVAYQFSYSQGLIDW
jgi:hypothetical protein